MLLIRNQLIFLNLKLKKGNYDKIKSQETNKINIVPTYENLLITYARIYAKMNEGGRKQIDQELSKMGNYGIY